MNDVMILRRGGGSVKTGLPAIYVNYPPGSACTCSNNNGKIYTAKDNSGLWLFTGLELGEWTVTATQGANSKSQSVSITKEGQLERVSLSYDLVLFDGGDNTAVTGGWGIKGHNVPTISKITVGDELYVTITGTSGANYKVWPIYPINTIDLSGHSTMKVNVKALSNTNKVFSLAILTDIEINQGFASGDPLAQTYIIGTGEFSLDISKIKGKYYPCIVGELNGGGASANMTATKVWLE